MLLHRTLPPIIVVAEPLVVDCLLVSGFHFIVIAMLDVGFEALCPCFIMMVNLKTIASNKKAHSLALG